MQDLRVCKTRARHRYERAGLHLQVKRGWTRIGWWWHRYSLCGQRVSRGLAMFSTSEAPCRECLRTAGVR